MSDVKIISVEAKRGYYLVTTSINDYKFEEDTIVKYEVFNDKEFPKSEFDKILKYNDEQVAFNKAIRYLGYGPRSSSEIIKYLKDKGFNDYKKTIKKLIEYKYIDDEKLASDLVIYYSSNLKGPNYILKKMDEKLISDEIKAKAIKEYTTELEEENCYKSCLKEVDKLKEYPIRKQKQNLYSKMISRGYKIDIIMRVIDKVELIDESNDNLIKDYNRIKDKAMKKELSDRELNSYIIERLLAKGYEYKDIKSIL